MNKKELIEKIEALPAENYKYRPYIDKKVVLALVRQLDEPQKVVVPQFVADWIEESKKHCKNVVEFFKYKYPNTEMIKWIESEKRFDLIARAWLDGYEVEKEKRYLVKVKGVNEECEYLVFGELSNTWKFRSLGSLEELKKHHTRKQLEEANFGWVFSCEGIEIEEVE